MTEFGDLDFDALTEEGQVDINEGEYESLIPDGSEEPGDFQDMMKRQFGDRLRAGYSKLRSMWQSRNPGKQVPEYMELDIREGIPGAPTQEWVDRMTDMMNETGEDEEESYVRRAKEVFPDLVSSKVRMIWAEDPYGQETLVVSLTRTNSVPYEVIDGDGRLHLERLPTTLQEALGSPALNPKLESVKTEISEAQQQISTQETEITRMKEEIERLSSREKDQGWEEAREMGKSAAEAGKIRNSYEMTIDKVLKNKAALEESNKRMKAELDGALGRQNDVLREIEVKSAQIEDLTKSLEDLERQLEEKQKIIDDADRSDEEREAAHEEIKELRERIAELNQEKERLETELGLTTKEKIKRALLKYGLPTAIVGAIAAAIGVIISMLKGAGNGVKKIGRGLKELGKKMAASIPGLIGSVLS
jgi:hypothetical protein